MGILLHGVFAAAPGEWAALLPIVEFVRFNTPAAHGLTPRDFDRGWSASSPLERELGVFDAGPAESAIDVVRRQLDAFRRVRQVTLEHRAKVAERYVALANRTRTSRLPELGDRVMFRDPKSAKKVAGHSAAARPLAGPFEVVEAMGARTTLRNEVTGEKVKAHADGIVYLPERVVDRERQLAIEPDAADTRPSPGQLLEAAASAPQRAESGKGPRRKVTLHPGALVAFESGAP